MRGQHVAIEVAVDRTRPDGLLEARGLARSFGETRALVDGSLSCAAVEVLAVVGENGSGKSTLVKILSGVLRPDAGPVVGGRAARCGSARRAPRCDTGIVTVFQEILVASPASRGRQRLPGQRPPARTPGRRSPRATRGPPRSLARLIDADRRGGPGRALSLMEHQLCVIARALLGEPRVLILDEATSTLDITDPRPPLRRGPRAVRPGPA